MKTGLTSHPADGATAATRQAGHPTYYKPS